MPDPLKIRLEAKTVKTNKCWLWEGVIDKYGYGRIMKEGKRVGTHRAAWMVYKGEIPDGLQVLHSCDVRNCVNPKHLFLGTHAENHLDKCDKDKVAWGDQHWNCKISDHDVQVLIESTLSSSMLARIFNISKGHVNYLKKGYRRTPECNKKEK